MSVAIIHGESNILSSLPELSLHANVIIFNDINKNLHLFIKHLLNTLKVSEDRDDFLKKLPINNPLNDMGDFDWVGEQISKDPAGLGDKHFLSSDERFSLCKEKVDQLTFGYTHINAFDEEQCKIFAKILDQYNTEVTLLNISNINHYDTNNQLQTTIPILTNERNDCLVMYSSGAKVQLFSRLTDSVHMYLRNIDLNYFSGKKTKKK